MAAAVDDLIGAVLDQIQTLGIERETVIWFQADGGATNELRVSSCGLPYRGGRNGKYREYKQGLFDVGMHVPAILRAPGFTESGQVWDHPMIFDGSVTTICKYGGRHGRGRDPWMDILPVLCGQSAGHEYLFWSFSNQRAVRKGDWKLLIPPSFPGDEVADKI